ncbi:MAG: flavodoxin family protein [Clostridiales bacterium]|jgi:multimeric flavodoxin WrbA|nr:flavodoxin family protein [Clostridiales bacterium]
MKTLVFNGSPNNSGETMTILNEMRKHLHGEADIVEAYRSHISPCIDCRHCWTNDECAIQDDMQQIYDNIDKYDNVILASPIHFTELSGMLLTVTSRLQMYWCAEFFRGTTLIKNKKNAVLILTGGGGASPAKPLSTAKNIFRHLNAELIGQVYSLSTNDIPAKDDRAAMEKAKALALELNERYALKTGKPGLT